MTDDTMERLRLAELSIQRLTDAYIKASAERDALRADAADEIARLIHEDKDGTLYKLLYPFVGDSGSTRCLRIDIARWVASLAKFNSTTDQKTAD